MTVGVIFVQKKRDSEREIWRRSWESGHSHSSCSLHSNATNAGSGTGKDDFWAALQTNYNYIMDTNLIDSCREARGECDGNATVEEQQVAECCEKVKKSNFIIILKGIFFIIYFLG